ncbi:MAG: hypothetical protein ABJE95_22775 [Byssovorax sp.]
MKTLLATLLALSVSAPALALADDSPAPAPPPPAVQSLPPAPPPPAGATAPEYPTDLEVAPKSSGVGYLAAGGVFTGIGALNLLTAPICKTDLIPDHSTQDACLIASLVVGGTFVVIGVPLLIVGASKRSTFKQWKAAHPIASGFGFTTASGGGMLTFGGQL